MHQGRLAVQDVVLVSAFELGVVQGVPVIQHVYQGGRADIRRLK